MPMSKLLKVYMTEDICNHLRTVSDEDLSVISTDFMNVYLLLAYLHKTNGHLAMHISKKPKIDNIVKKVKGKGILRRAEVALGVPGRLRPWIFSTFGTTMVVGRQPNAPAAFTSGEISGTHFQRLSQPQGTWFCWKEPRKKFQVTPPGIDSGTVGSSAAP